MIAEKPLTLQVTPVITYPREAAMGRHYLLEIDLRPDEPWAWPADGPEEFVVYCRVETLPHFSHEHVGEGTIVLHRFGGTYGPAKFWLTPERRGSGEIRIVLLNEAGLPVAAVKAGPIQVRAHRPTPEPQEPLFVIDPVRPTPEPREPQFSVAAVARGPQIFEVIVGQDGAGSLVDPAAPRRRLATAPFRLPSAPFPPDSSYDEPYPYIVELARRFDISEAEIEREAGLPLTRRVGQQLYASLFPEQVAADYQKALKDASTSRTGQPLQVRLRISPAFEGLPWEALCRTELGEDRLLALHERLTLVRIPFERPAKREVPTEPPEQLRVLVVLATQRDDPRLYPINAAAHKKRLKAILDRLDRTGEAHVSWVEGSRTLEKLEDKLQQAERTQEPIHLLHIVCHGEVMPDGGALYFNDHQGSPQPLRLDQLRNLWERYPAALGQVRLVVLNACLSARPPATNPFNSFAAALVRAGVPAVSAMQFAIADEATLHFTDALYSGLIGERLAVDSAMALARRRLFEAYSDNASWIIPVLYMHPAVVRPLRLRRLIEPDKPRVELDQPAGVLAFFQARGLKITTFDQVEQIFELRETGAASTNRTSVPITLEEDGGGPVARPITTLAAPRSLVVCVPPGCGKTTLRLAVGHAVPTHTLVIHIPDLKALDRTANSEALLRLVLRAALESLARGLNATPARWSAVRGNQIATARLWALHKYFHVALTRLPEMLSKSVPGADQYAEYDESGAGSTLQRWLDELWEVARVAGYTRGYQMLVEDEQRDDGRRAAQRDERLRALLVELHDAAPHEYAYSVKLFVTESVYARLGVGVADGLAELTVYRVRWSDGQLAALLESRLREYSPTARNQAETSLGPDLFARSVAQPLPRLAAKAGGSPQEFLRWLRKVIERHCKQAADPQRSVGQEIFNQLGL